MPSNQGMYSKLRRIGDSFKIELSPEDLWSDHTHNDNESKQISTIPVICRSTRESNPNQIIVDKPYMIDRFSIWIDHDGDSYGTVYDLRGNRIGQMLLSHFRCI